MKVALYRKFPDKTWAVFLGTQKIQACDPKIDKNICLVCQKAIPGFEAALRKLATSITSHKLAKSTQPPKNF